jgi:RNA polymerase sigma factor (sigma-70 family)
VAPYPTSQPAPQTTPPDEDLAVLSRRDPEAFGLLYDRYADPVFRYCWRRLGTREDAEDATQQVFAKALAAIPRYRESSFRSWLFNIAHNVLIDGYRAHHDERDLSVADLLADPSPTPEQAVLAAEANRSVRDLLAGLPGDQRKVAERRLADLTDNEIADVLHLSHGNVRVLQHRAATRLRAMLGVVRPPKEPSHV